MILTLCSRGVEEPESTPNGGCGMANIRSADHCPARESPRMEMPPEIADSNTTKTDSLPGAASK